VRPSRPELSASLDLHYLAIAEEKTLRKVLVVKKERIVIEVDSEILVTTRSCLLVRVVYILFSKQSTRGM
jgi:hypothetical protein